MGQWNDPCDPRSTGGFAGTVGDYYVALGRANGWADPYAVWIQQGGQPTCQDYGNGAHPIDVLNCGEVQPVTVQTSLFDKLEARTYGVPNYILGAGAGLGLAGLLASKRKLWKRNPRRRRR